MNPYYRLKQTNPEYGIPEEFKGQVIVIDDIFTEEEMNQLEQGILYKTQYEFVRDVTESEPVLKIDGTYVYQGRPAFSYEYRIELCGDYIDYPYESQVCYSRTNTSYSTGVSIDKLFSVILEKVNFPIYSYMKIRSFFQLNLNIKDKHIVDTPHIDCDYPHLAVIYYPIDSDGDTIIYENMLDMDNIYEWYFDEDEEGQTAVPIQPSTNELVIKKRIKPKRGRVVIFDGLHWHTAEQCKEYDKRVVVNANVIAKLGE